MNNQNLDRFERTEITIDRITYARLVSTGNYENEKIEVSSVVEEGRSPDEVLAFLKQFVGERTHSLQQYQDWCNEYWAKKADLNNLIRKLQEAEEQWEKARLFLVTQGLKKEEDLPSFPALPFAKEQGQEANNAEFVENDLEDIPM
ncbi:hypothetical protein [Gloeothece citriformis]|nr:hypothetical protein [Gloeothece citriformis]